MLLTAVGPKTPLQKNVATSLFITFHPKLDIQISKNIGIFVVVFSLVRNMIENN